MALIDLSGHRFGMLVASSWRIIKSPGKRRHVYWKCHCDCGADIDVIGESLRRGATKSCGCNRKNNVTNYRHGEAPAGRPTKEYRIWLSMKHRCNNPRATAYQHYGGRGIQVCDRWLKDFAAFREDMKRCPDGYSIERIDYNGPYSPENCKWIPRNLQSANTRRTIFVDIGSVRVPLKHLVASIGMNYYKVRRCIKRRGCSPIDAIRSLALKAINT